MKTLALFLLVVAITSASRSTLKNKNALESKYQKFVYYKSFMIKNPLVQRSHTLRNVFLKVSKYFGQIFKLNHSSTIPENYLPRISSSIIQSIQKKIKTKTQEKEA